jgi:Tol biopolymer transport system component
VNAWPGAWSPDGTTLAYVLSRPSVPTPGEWALAVRRIGGPERIVGGWSKESVLLPSGWTPDGGSVLGSYDSPLGIRYKLALWRMSEAGIASEKRIPIDAPRYHLYQATFSPDGKWLSFVAFSVDEAENAGTWVAPAAGAPPSGWTRIASDHDGVDKPRWAPNGRTLYFISKRNSSFFNLRGARFDPVRGVPVGDPFMITRFDSPGLVISPDVRGGAEIGIAQRRAVLTMATVTGNIWMLDNVDK